MIPGIGSLFGGSGDPLNAASDVDAGFTQGAGVSLDGSKGIDATTALALSIPVGLALLGVVYLLREGS